jgi:two-component system, sensor histidine kinase and response regulator
MNNQNMEEFSGVGEAQDGMCLVDEQGLIVEWSPGQEAITGLGRMETLGRAIWDIQYQFINQQRRNAEEYGRLKKVFTQILATGEIPPPLRFVEVSLERSDGITRNLQIMASPIKTASGWMLSYLFRDITAQKRMELALQEARAAAELANRAKGQFLARMSHEIRTPLHGITGLTELLASTSLTIEQREYLNMIRSSADLLLQVVNDILDFSKIESGRLELEEAPFDLGEIVERASDAVALRAFGKGLELVIHLSPAAPTALRGDPARLQQVLVNLLNNAVKFTEQGQVVLRVQVESEDAETVTFDIAVEDTGIGIAEEKQAVIFEAFRQSDGSTTRQHGGTGLGLSIAAQLVELMGGRIRVESKLHQGSRFQFALPFKKQGVPNHFAPPSEWQGVRALIVEDNALARLALAENLTAWGLQVTVAENGDTGLQALDRARVTGHTYRLVLLDATLSNPRGYAVAASIRRDFPCVSLVLLLSPAHIHSDIDRCRELGINRWLLKPVKRLYLRHAVAAMLETKGERDSESEMVQESRSVLAPSRRGLRILLADDNLVGQVIGKQMLTGLGHTVETASNGQEVLAHLKESEFDLLLMDLEMPEMDGLQATRLIRQKEAEAGDRRVPILAVSAYASTGNRDMAMEAGMDGYLSKPFKIERLREALEPFRAPGERPLDPPVFDRYVALEAVGGSDEILEEVVEIFLQQDYPRHMQALKMAVENQDGEMMRQAAHGLKGALASFGGNAAAAIASQLQEIGVGGEIDRAPRKLVELESAVECFAACFAPSREHDASAGGLGICQSK